MKFLTKMLPVSLLLSAGIARADTTITSADAQKWLAFFDKIVDTAVADQDSCPKMAKDINALIDANKDLLDKAAKAQSEGKKLPADAQKHMEDGAKKMMPAFQKCGKDKDVGAAFKRLPHGQH